MINGTFAVAGKTYAFHDVRKALGAESYDRLAYVTQIDKAHIHIAQFRGTHGKRIHSRKRDGNRASGALTFL